MNEGIRNDIMINIEDQEPKIVNDVAGTEEPQQIIDHPRSSGREQIPPRKYDDYKLYVNVEDEEESMLTTCKANADNQAEDKDDDGTHKAIVHYIMVHYSKKEILRKGKKKYKSKVGQYSLNAGLCQFGDRGETATTNKLLRFNKYKVFESVMAESLSKEEKKKALA